MYTARRGPQQAHVRLKNKTKQITNTDSVFQSEREVFKKRELRRKERAALMEVFLLH